MKLLLSCSRLPVPALRCALGLVGALGALQLACAGAPPIPVPSAGLAPVREVAETPGPPVLRPGEAVERKVSGEGRDEILLDLEAGWYARVVIDQGRLDVAATLLDPGGKSLVATDVPAGWTEPERLSLITLSAGMYRLNVGLHNPKAAAGLYKVVLEELRPAVPGDRPVRDHAQLGSRTDATGPSAGCT